MYKNDVLFPDFPFQLFGFELFLGITNYLNNTIKDFGNTRKVNFKREIESVSG